jgi:import receptor subunit TOM70
MAPSQVPVPVPPVPMRGAPVHFTASSTAQPPSSLWDRVTSWASEHKAVVYTIAGVAVVVTAGGVAYYLTDSVGSLTGFDIRSRM